MRKEPLHPPFKRRYPFGRPFVARVGTPVWNLVFSYGLKSKYNIGSCTIVKTKVIRIMDYSNFNEYHKKRYTYIANGNGNDFETMSYKQGNLSDWLVQYVTPYSFNGDNIGDTFFLTKQEAHRAKFRFSSSFIRKK